MTIETVAPVLVLVRCPWCNVVLCEVQAPTFVRTRCHGRRCGMWVERAVQ